MWGKVPQSNKQTHAVLEASALDRHKGPRSKDKQSGPTCRAPQPHPDKLTQEQWVILGAQQNPPLLYYALHSYFYLESTTLSLHSPSTAWSQQQRANRLVNVSSCVWWPCSLNISVHRREALTPQEHTQSYLFSPSKPHESHDLLILLALQPDGVYSQTRSSIFREENGRRQQPARQSKKA